MHYLLAAPPHWGYFEVFTACGEWWWSQSAVIFFQPLPGGLGALVPLHGLYLVGDGRTSTWRTSMAINT
jgi:hypothetical protein